jgi:two-component system chemotaxis response regulator CheY
MRVLVVDDFEVVKLMMRNALKKLGIADVSEASNGKEALACLKESRDQKRAIQLVLCDWNMPEMSGLEFLRAVRKDPVTADLHVALITATSDQAELAEAFKLGVKDYIVKPIAPDALQAKLQEIIGKVKTT